MFKSANTTSSNNREEKLSMFYLKNLKRLLIATGITASTFSYSPCIAQSQSFVQKDSVLIAQTLGGIVREIPLTEIPLPAMSGAKTATGAEFTAARIEIQSDGSLRYILRGKNQQGFAVEVQVTPIGSIVQVDEQIDSSGVPEIAVKVFKKWVPNDSLVSTWRSTRLGEVFYQFVIQDYWLEISPDGNKIVIFRQKIKY